MAQAPPREGRRREFDQPVLTMRRFSLFLLLAASLAAALPAAAQTTPRRPPADTLRFGATRPAAGDSIAMARYDEDGADSVVVARADVADDDEADEDSVPRKPRSGPYARAEGTGPFSVQASGQAAARPAQGEVVWLGGRAARPAADSARRDTARAGTGQRVSSSSTTRRDTASTATNRPTRRDSASTATNRPARRDSTATASRPAARDTAGARRNGQAAAGTTGRPGSTSTTGTTGGRTGSTSTGTTGGRTGSTPPATSSTGGRTGANSGSAARARTHTVASGETFYAIARRYGVTAAQLRAINPGVVMDSLEIGDVLRLPASARDSRAGSTGTQAPRAGAQTPPRTGNQSTSQAQRRSHTVAAGETLFGIARRYGVTVAAIREANELETDQVRTGQRLVIPPAR
jgi:LysM repeat protein